MSVASESAAEEVRATHHLTELEGLRALAAVAVVLTHAGFLSGATGRDVLPGFLARMDIGVAVFFVLSGFLLYLPHARSVDRRAPSPPVRRYALRRAARLVPAWLVVLAATPVLVPASRSASLEVWVANLLQLQSLRTEWDLPGLAQLWSLSTEVAFYLALPVLAVIVGGRARGRGGRTHVLALVVVAGLVWGFRFILAQGVLPEGWSWVRTLPATGDWFVVGMVLAVIVVDDHLRAAVGGVVRSVPWHLYGLAAIGLWVLTTRLAGPYDLAAPTAWQSTVKHAGYTLVAGLVVVPSVLGARTVVSQVLSSRPLTYVGTISYGVFLWHLPVMFRVRDTLGLATFGGGFWMTVLLTLLVSSVLAAASWHLLEAPVQARVRHLTSRATAGDNAQRDDQQAQRA